MSTDIEQSDLLTIQEVARIFRVDDTTVRRWIRRGALEGVPLPHSGKRETYRVRKAAVDTLLGIQNGSTHID